MVNDEANSRRDDFLLAMYHETWGNINRHILVIWQSVAALLGAFAILALIDKKVLPVDLACSLLVLTCAWVGAHVIDANYWFARNLLIITNIERQFLTKADASLIHPYFLKHRKLSLLDHLVIQSCLAGAIFVLILGWHFFTRVEPGLHISWRDFDPPRSLPYLASIACAGYLVYLRDKQKRSASRLLKRSPGAPIK